MSSCTKLTANLAAIKCGFAPIPGTGNRVLLINYDDVDRKLSTVADNVITNLILNAGAKAYEFESAADSTEGTPTFNKGTYLGNFIHTLILRIFARAEAGKKFVNTLNGAKVIAIVENADGGTGVTTGEVTYEAYGWDAGLLLSEIAAPTTMADLVVYQVTLASGETARESSLPKSVFKTDLATTKTMLDGLVAVA